MTLTEDVLGWIETNWPDGSFPSDLRRVNRNDSRLFPGGAEDRREKLRQANYVGVARGGDTPTPIGTEFGYRSVPVLNVRVVGLDAEQFGHIDDHADFRTLVENIKTAIRAEDEHPSTTGAGTYHTIIEQDATDSSATGGDYYAETWDLQFRGYDGF